jgi:hypothetical protein
MSEHAVETEGQVYYTGLQPTPAFLRECFPSLSLPGLPESEWVDIDRRQLFHDLSAYPDQLQSSGCTGFSSAMVAAKVRYLLGQPWHKLSGAYLYSLINGGRDQGSNIGAALKALQTYGCCREEICDIHQQFNYIYRANTKQFDGDAARFKAEVVVQRVETAEEAMIALQRGAVLEFAVKAFSGWGKLDSEGCLSFQPGGANHAVHADGCKKTSKGWCLDLQTWTPNWADKSRGLWPIKYLENTQYQEMWAIFGMTDDPQDEHDPPAPVAL